MTTPKRKPLEYLEDEEGNRHSSQEVAKAICEFLLREFERMDKERQAWQRRKKKINIHRKRRWTKMK